MNVQGLVLTAANSRLSNLGVLLASHLGTVIISWRIDRTFISSVPEPPLLVSAINRRPPK